MKVLLLTEESSDFSKILHSCAVDVEQMTVSQAALKNISSYDAYCVLSSEKVLDARVHYHLEKAAKEVKSQAANVCKEVLAKLED